MSSRTVDAFLKLEEQLIEERVSALTRIGGRLDALIRSLDSLSQQHADASGKARERVLAAYRREHAQARRYRWYLEVQRESVGLVRHEVLDRVFPLPPPTPESSTL